MPRLPQRPFSESTGRISRDLDIGGVNYLASNYGSPRVTEDRDGSLIFFFFSNTPSVFFYSVYYLAFCSALHERRSVFRTSHDDEGEGSWNKFNILDPLHVYRLVMVQMDFERSLNKSPPPAVV